MVDHSRIFSSVNDSRYTVIRSTLPDCFKPLYSCTGTTCIIDCSEIFIQRPSALSARAETYSNYKHHNTAKFLIAISPTGEIIYVSKYWGGRTSDKNITAHSGFLDKLIHGDLVLADWGFDITEPLALCGASLAIPPFTKGKSQLSKKEVETARALLRVRIHVERAIGRLKNFKILKCTLPITLVKASEGNEFVTTDKILFVCAALCNMQPPLVWWIHPPVVYLLSTKLLFLDYHNFNTVNKIMYTYGGNVTCQGNKHEYENYTRDASIYHLSDNLKHFWLPLKFPAI